MNNNCENRSYNICVKNDCDTCVKSSCREWDICFVVCSVLFLFGVMVALMIFVHLMRKLDVLISAAIG